MKLERKVCGKFVSQKVSVIRWVPNRQEYGGTGFTTDQGRNFVTGSWDDQVTTIFKGLSFQTFHTFIL